jgi:hypothetical protein
MLRKSMVALLAIAAAALLTADTASARGGFGGGYRGGGVRVAGVGMGGYRAAAIGGGYRVAGMRTGTFANNAGAPASIRATARGGDSRYCGGRGWCRTCLGHILWLLRRRLLQRGLAGNGYYPPYDNGSYVYNAGGYYGDGGCSSSSGAFRRLWLVLRPVQVCN